MILNNPRNIFLFILWIIAVISLILIITCRKKINNWLRREKRNKVVHFNPEDYYKLDLGKKKYYYLKIELAYLKEILRKEDLELVIIDEIKKLIILNKNDFFDVSEYLDEYYKPKVKCLNFQSNIEMKEIKPKETIINI
jgi:hypothetical protein